MIPPFWLCHERRYRTQHDCRCVDYAYHVGVHRCGCGYFWEG